MASLSGPSIADRYTDSNGWADVLQPHGWRCLDTDPDADGTRWRHPTATTTSSATIRYGRLFVWSPNTTFSTPENGKPNGYTKFRAYAVLNHGSDMSAAAKHLREAAA